MTPKTLARVGFLLPYPAIVLFGLVAYLGNITNENNSTTYFYVAVGTPMLLALGGLFMIWSAAYSRSKGLPKSQKINSIAFSVIWSTVLVVVFTLSTFMMMVYMYTMRIRL